MMISLSVTYLYKIIKDAMVIFLSVTVGRVQGVEGSNPP